ncbi:MAG: HAD family hydrolase [Bacillus sp. (in: Bacteria)]|nr:HAD family hydrolase [Bacillus sp. (in: firmicutes)]MCM1426609.1 HAD family hydrolase [Eubacterium sp.]
MLKAVIFDLDGTLYDYDELDKRAGQNVEAFTCKMLGIGADKFREAYLFGRKETKRQLSDFGAGHNRLLYFQKMLEYLGISPMPMSLRIYDEYWNTFLQNMTLFPGAKEVIGYLRQKRIPIMICTDLTAHIQHRKIEALGIAADINYLVSSEEAGREKPAKEVFALCLEKLKLPPEHIWYVGDNFEKDIKGAAQAGMQPVWFRRTAESSGNVVERKLWDEHTNREISYKEISDYAQLLSVMKE